MVGREGLRKDMAGSNVKQMDDLVPFLMPSSPRSLSILSNSRTSCLKALNFIKTL